MTSSISALSASTSASRTTSDSIGRLSSSQRIRRAADDAAGLGVATNLETTASSTLAGVRNANDGISMLHTAEGAAGEVTDILQRMRDLSMQSASGTLGDDSRAHLQDEYASLGSELTRIAKSTEFNGTKLADGSVDSVDAQVGEGSGDDSRISMSMMDLSAESLGVAGSIGSIDGARGALDAIDSALDTVNEYRSDMGATHERLTSAVASGETLAYNSTAAASQITDSDMAFDVVELVKEQMLEKVNIASMAQAKQMNMTMMSLLA